jgi:hypothetical protein
MHESSSRSRAMLGEGGAAGSCVTRQRRPGPPGFRLGYRNDRWRPPSVDVPLSYTGGVGVTELLLAVHICNWLRQAILRRGGLARRPGCLVHDHDLLLFPAVLPLTGFCRQLLTEGHPASGVPEVSAWPGSAAATAGLGQRTGWLGPASLPGRSPGPGCDRCRPLDGARAGG